MTEPRDEALLRARELRVSRGARDVVHGIDLDLRDGEITVLLGPNGAGKSTLLEALAGLLPYAGELHHRGRIALALQSPDLARRSVLANITLALGWWGVPRGERRDRAQRALAAMRADHLRDRPAGTLSGGERRRVHLARAVAVRPDVLLLDEPFAGLDPAARGSLLDDTGAALREWCSSTLTVVHDRAEAWALADRLVVLIEGRLAAEGTPTELFSSPPSIEVARFLGYDGSLTQDDGALLLTRTQHVVLDPTAELRARVVRALPVEDGLRLELAVERGRLYTLAPLPGPAPGDELRVRITGGVRFAAGGDTGGLLNGGPERSAAPGEAVAERESRGRA
jgi:ABC-type sulfate/molybdate transport systems ATPase subunit